MQNQSLCAMCVLLKFYGMYRNTIIKRNLMPDLPTDCPENMRLTVRE